MTAVVNACAESNPTVYEMSPNESMHVRATCFKVGNQEEAQH